MIVIISNQINILIIIVTINHYPHSLPFAAQSRPASLSAPRSASHAAPRASRLLPVQDPLLQSTGSSLKRFYTLRAFAVMDAFQLVQVLLIAGTVAGGFILLLRYKRQRPGPVGIKEKTFVAHTVPPSTNGKLRIMDDRLVKAHMQHLQSKSV